jgi:hypothetical protein
MLLDAVLESVNDGLFMDMMEKRFDVLFIKKKEWFLQRNLHVTSKDVILLLLLVLIK